jgi:ABC-2 type transport system permease protein
MALRNLIVREIKVALKNPAFIASLILLFIFYVAIGGITRVGVSQAAEEARMMYMRMPVVVEESTKLVEEALKALNASVGEGVKLYPSVDSALAENMYVIIIPRNSTNDLLTKQKAFLRAFVKLDSLSQVAVQSRVGAVTSIASIVSEAFREAYTKVYNISKPPKLEVVLGEPNITLIAFGRSVSVSEVNALTGLSIASMFLIGMVMGMTTSYAATAVAIEKSEKAFEMLLAQPIPRREVVIAKIVGAIVIAILTGAIYISALLLMIILIASPSTGTSMPGFSSSSIGIDLVASIVLIMVLGLVFSGAVGVVLGSVSQDERSAGVLSMPITFLYIGFALVAMFVNLPTNTASAIVYGALVVPLPHLLAVSRISGDVTPLAVGAAVSLTLCISVILLAIEIFNRDVVILGLRLGRRMRERQ